MSFPSRHHDLLRGFHLPVLQEFFCRTVEAYPRTQTGLLGSILNTWDEDALRMEMVALHGMASFPLSFQRRHSEDAVLTSRFRINVQLVVDSLMSHVPDQATRDMLRPHMVCPAGPSAPQHDLSSASNSELWAAQFLRLVGRLVGSGRSSRYGEDECDYDLYAVHYMCNGLATLLSVQIGPHTSLVSLIDSLVDNLDL